MNFRDCGWWTNVEQVSQLKRTLFLKFNYSPALLPCLHAVFLAVFRDGAAGASGFNLQQDQTVGLPEGLPRHDS